MTPERRRRYNQTARYMQQRYNRQAFHPDTSEALAEAQRIYRITPGEILSGIQERLPVAARTRVIHRLRSRGHSLVWIGKELGGLHHSTIHHALQKSVALEPLPEEWKPDESGIWAI